MCWESSNSPAEHKDRRPGNAARATATQNLGSDAFDQGDYTRARALLCEALRIRRELGLPRGYAYSFEFIADVDEAEKRYEHAVQLLAAAATLRIRIGAPVEQINQKANEDALARLRAQLGNVAFCRVTDCRAEGGGNMR